MDPDPFPGGQTPHPHPHPLLSLPLPLPPSLSDRRRLAGGRTATAPGGDGGLRTGRVAVARTACRADGDSDLRPSLPGCACGSSSNERGREGVGWVGIVGPAARAGPVAARAGWIRPASSARPARADAPSRCPLLLPRAPAAGREACRPPSGRLAGRRPVGLPAAFREARRPPARRSGGKPPTPPAFGAFPPSLPPPLRVARSALRVVRVNDLRVRCCMAGRRDAASGVGAAPGEGGGGWGGWVGGLMSGGGVCGGRLVAARPRGGGRRMA